MAEPPTQSIPSGDAPDPVLSLLIAWDERRRLGQEPTPEELCSDRPDLLPELRARLAVLRRLDDLATVPVVIAPDAPDELVAVPGYEVLGVLGRGGMGVVYKARQLGLNRVVALKMILTGGHASEQERQRFRQEAEALARLKHPNIVQVYEVGEDNGRPYFTIEYCAGGSLKDRLDGTPMPPARSAGLVETLAVAVQAAHEAGVVHRDLKPANVLLSSSEFGVRS